MTELSIIEKLPYIVRDGKKRLTINKATIYVYLDYRAVHYVKILMDEIFRRDNFINQIIWFYKSGGASRKQYSRKHDTILVYKKSKEPIFRL